MSGGFVMLSAAKHLSRPSKRPGFVMLNTAKHLSRPTKRTTRVASPKKKSIDQSLRSLSVLPYILLANSNTLPPIQFITDGAFANSWGNRRCRFIVHIADLSACFSSTNFQNASQISYSVKAPMKVAHQQT
jgi:hypothetical protein